MPRHSTKKIDISTAKHRIIEWLGNEYEILDFSGYKTTQSKILVRHKTCGTEFSTTYNKVQAGQRCPKKQCWLQKMQTSKMVVHGQISPFQSSTTRQKNVEKSRITRAQTRIYLLIDKLGQDYVPIDTTDKNHITIKHSVCGTEFVTGMQVTRYKIPCPHCRGNTTPKGRNFGTFEEVHPDIARHIINKDVLQYSAASREVAQIQCPYCGNITELSLYRLHGEGYKCQNCKDNRSTGEKMFRSILNQCRVEYQTEAKFPWCIYPKHDGTGQKSGRYDFVIGKYIVEIDGSQHFQECDITRTTLEEQQYDDKQKDNLASENGYTIIRINHSSHTFDQIKQSIYNSKLSDILPLNSVNWDQVKSDSSLSEVMSVVDLWNNGKSSGEIQNELKLSKSYVRHCLLFGTKCGKCNYTPDESQKRSHAFLSMPVILLNTGQEFSSIHEAGKTVNNNELQIGRCCKKQIPYACLMPNGDPMIWRYLEDKDDIKNLDALILQAKEHIKISKQNSHKDRKRGVQCTTTGEIFDSIVDAAKHYGTKQGMISLCAHGDLPHAGKHNGKSLQWQWIGIPPKRTGSKKSTSKPIICVETQEVFNSISSTATKYGVSAPVLIRTMLKGERSWACQDESGNKLTWKYLAIDQQRKTHPECDQCVLN